MTDYCGLKTKVVYVRLETAFRMNNPIKRWYNRPRGGFIMFFSWDFHRTDYISGSEARYTREYFHKTVLFPTIFRVHDKLICTFPYVSKFITRPVGTSGRLTSLRTSGYLLSDITGNNPKIVVVTVNPITGIYSVLIIKPWITFIDLWLLYTN